MSIAKGASRKRIKAVADAAPKTWGYKREPDKPLREQAIDILKWLKHLPEQLQEKIRVVFGFLDEGDLDNADILLKMNMFEMFDNNSIEDRETVVLRGALIEDLFNIIQKVKSGKPYYSTVENYEETSYNPPVQQSPDIGGATLDEKLDLIEGEYGEAAKEAFARRAPARDGAVTGMAARGREVASVPEAPVRAKKPVARPPSRVKHSFIEVSRQTNLRHRHSALVEHYEGRTAWEDWKGEADPTPDDFNKWLDSWASDRRRVGLLYSDLRYLDWSAYVKLKNWKKRDSGVSKKVIADFGLPTKIKKPRPKRVVRSKRSSPVGQSVAL